MTEKLPNLPVLEGWVTLTQAAEMLGFTRQHAYRKARLANDGLRGGWRSVHRLGTPTIYVVSLSEVEEMLANRDT